jgi:hypothetical protein
MPPKVRFPIDSALEGEGFEPSVPVRGTTLFATMVTRCPKVRFASNSLLEGARFEPSVPPQKRTVAEATRRSLQTVTTVSTLVEAGIDRNLAAQKPPFRVTPASGFAGTGVQIDRKLGQNTHFKSAPP